MNTLKVIPTYTNGVLDSEYKEKLRITSIDGSVVEEAHYDEKYAFSYECKIREEIVPIYFSEIKKVEKAHKSE